MNRRSFLGAILAAGVAPAVVRYAHLMPVRTLDSGILLPWRDWYDSVALNDRWMANSLAASAPDMTGSLYEAFAPKRAQALAQEMAESVLLWGDPRLRYSPN